MRRSKTHGVVWRETISERHLTLPIDGDARYVVTTKQCRTCKEHLPLAHYYTESESKGGGTRIHCVVCWDTHNGRVKPKTLNGSLVSLMRS
jgi:hypothetical protein